MARKKLETGTEVPGATTLVPKSYDSYPKKLNDTFKHVKIENAPDDERQADDLSDYAKNVLLDSPIGYNPFLKTDYTQPPRTDGTEYVPEPDDLVSHLGNDHENDGHTS